MADLSFRVPDDVQDAYEAHHVAWKAANANGVEQFLFSYMPTSAGTLFALRDCHVDKCMTSGRYQFTLVASPTRHAVVTKKWEPIMEPGLRAWLETKLDGCADIVDLHARTLAPTRCDKPGHHHMIHRARFTGTIDVKNAEEFTRLYRSGIGRGRRFGLGMLVVKKEGV